MFKMKKETQQLPEGITQQMIDAAKAKGLDVRLAEVPIDDEGNTRDFLVCVPSRTVLASLEDIWIQNLKKQMIF